jgi:hypothetical protein
MNIFKSENNIYDSRLRKNLRSVILDIPGKRGDKSQ